MKGILCTVILLGGIIFTMMSTSAMLAVKKAKNRKPGADIKLANSNERMVRAISLT